MSRLLRGLRALVLACPLATGLAACGEQVELLAAVSESEANEVLSTLLAAGLDVSKVAGKEGMVSVVVADTQVSEALRIMRANGLPREQFARMGQVFRKEGLISSPLEERARYIYAISQELAETLSQIDGVITARVHVVLPDQTAGATTPVAPSSAAVFIKYKPLHDLESVVPQIKRLVVNSISNLSYDKVSVVLVAASPPAPEPAVPETVSLLSLEITPASRGRLVLLVTSLSLLAMTGTGAAGAMYWMWRIRPQRTKAGDDAQA